MDVLLNMQLITNEISIRNNQLPPGEFKFNPTFTRNISRIDETHAATELRMDAVNTEDNPFPVDITVSISGVFDISALEEKDVEFFLKYQAVQILFPYVRNAVSSLTSTALMPPIILPVINAQQLFPEQE